VLLEIDWQGARQVRESMPDCVTVFILPPSLAELERRLRDRRTDSEAIIARRLRDAVSDMQHWDEFDYVIINDKLDVAVADLDAVFAGSGQAQSVSNAGLRDRIQGILGL
jgi:guanylate kinase